MYIVEVRRDADELAGSMGRMRDWLDTQQIEPRFEFDGTIFRLEFSIAREAAAFAHAFDGQVGSDRNKLAA
jgi:hypothetical protein